MKTAIGWTMTTADLKSRVRTWMTRFEGSRTSRVHFEQAVYGSFSFRNAGYGFLAQSPGARSEWLTEFRTACQRIGERPAAVVESSSLFALRMTSGSWLVVGMSPQGADDQGRPGALGFHGLILSAREYRKAGSSPFALAGFLRSDWSAETSILPSGVGLIEATRVGDAPDDPRVGRIVEALGKGRRVVLESPVPIDELASRVWNALPIRERGRLSVATWAFGNANRFDLLAVPRLSGVSFDGSYVLEGEPAEASA
jgi:hypothetical protein